MKKLTLYQVLSGFTKAKLLAMCRALRYGGYSKLNKLELAKYVADILLQPEGMTRRLSCLSDREYALFERIAAVDYLEVKNFSEEDCAAVDDLGVTMYVCMDKSTGRLYVCEDVKAVFTSFEASPKFHELRKQVSWIFNCVKLSAYLYGAVPDDVLHKMYFRHPDFQSQASTRMDMVAMVMIPEDIMLAYCGKLEENIIPGYKDVYIFDLWVEDFEGLLQEQENKPFYIPTYQELVDFSEHGYLQNTPYCKAMRKFLMDNFALPPRVLYSCMAYLWEGSAIGDSPQMVLQRLLEETCLEPTEKQLDKMISLAFNLHNNTRTMINRGYTPNELSRMHQNRLATRTLTPVSRPESLEDSFEAGMLPLGVKVGRNEPCPCGSGKKYKRCCGR